MINTCTLRLHVLDERMIRRLVDFEDSGGLPMTAHIYVEPGKPAPPATVTPGRLPAS